MLGGEHSGKVKKKIHRCNFFFWGITLNSQFSLPRHCTEQDQEPMSSWQDASLGWGIFYPGGDVIFQPLVIETVRGYLQLVPQNERKGPVWNVLCSTRALVHPFLGLTQAPLLSHVDLCARTSQSRQSVHVKGIKSLACVILTNSINIAGYISLSEHLRTSCLLYTSPSPRDA